MQNRTRLAAYRRAIEPFLCLLAFAAAGCSDLAPGDDTYIEKNLDPSIADWSCLGQPEPPPPEDYPEYVTYTFPMVEWVTNNPIPGRSIQVCALIEPACLRPLTSVVNIVEGARDVSVQILAGQNVFLLLKAPGYFDTTLYFDGALYEDQRGGRIQMLTPDVIGGVAQQAQLPLDPTLGVLAIRAHDCRGTIVGGALYSIDDNPTSIPYTVVNGLVRADSPAVPAVVTSIPSDNSPWAGFANVPTTGITVFGVLVDGMREIGTADIPVRATTVNAVEVRALNHL